jgi:hypothetical protein
VNPSSLLQLAHHLDVTKKQRIHLLIIPLLYMVALKPVLCNKYPERVWRLKGLISYIVAWTDHQFFMFSCALLVTFPQTFRLSILLTCTDIIFF